MVAKKTSRKSTKGASSKKSSAIAKRKPANTTRIHKHSCSCCNQHQVTREATGGSFYFLGFVGAAVYYLLTATGFWMGVLGILKAIVWPAMLVFHLLGL